MPTKRLQLFRNGEASRPAASFAYNSNRTRTVDQLREECSKLLGMNVSNIYAADGDRVRSLEQLDKENILVCSDRQAFRRAEYDKGTRNSLSVRDQGRSVSPRGRGRRHSADSRAPSREASSQSIRPFTSYLDINKSNYGVGTARYKEWENTFEAKHIFLTLSGEPDFEPKPYCYRNRVTKTWEALLTDIKGIVKPLDGGDVKALYSAKRHKEAKKFKHLKEGETYIVCGEMFYEEEDEKKARRKNSRRSSRRGGSRRSARSLSRSMSARRDDGLKPVHERPDQTHPENVLFHTFLNGNGYQVNPCGFNQIQLNRGMPWVIERVSAPYGVNGQKLTTMGGIEIEHTEDLINRGAYVLIPATQKFKAAWYILKDGMIDTTNLTPGGDNNRNRLTANARTQSAGSRRSNRSNSRTRKNSARSSNRGSRNNDRRPSTGSSSPVRRKSSSDSSSSRRRRPQRAPSTGDSSNNNRQRRAVTASSNGSSQYNGRRNVQSADSRNSSPPRRRSTRRGSGQSEVSNYRQSTQARSNYRTTTGYSDDSRQSTPNYRRR